MTKPLLVLLHELGGSARSWDHVLRHLRPFEIEAVAVDFPGSGRQRDTLVEPVVDAYAADVLTHLAAKHWAGGGRQTFVVGVAFGAAVAAEVAVRQPDLVRGVGYVAMAPDLRPDTVGYVEARNVEVRKHGMLAVANASLSVTYPTTCRLAAPLRFLAYRRAFLEHDSEGYARASAALAHAGPRLETTLRTVSCPVHVMACTRDSHFSIDEIRRVTTVVANCGSFTVVRSGHFPHVQRPRAMARFCQRVAGSDL